MPAHRLTAALATLALLFNSGCCSLARLFCGPDTTPWISVDRSTHRAALATFLEALRRDDPREVYLALSESYKQELGGIGSHEAFIVYEQLKERVPYLHLAGYLTVPEAPMRVADGGVSYVLDLDGQPLQVQLVRTSYWEVRYSAGGPKESSGFLDSDSFHSRVTLDTIEGDDFDPARTRLELEPITFESPGVDALELEQIDSVGYFREWKITNLVIPQ